MFTEFKHGTEELKSHGNLIIVCGVSGSGKTTMIASALTSVENLKYLKTYTTRKPRSEEEAKASIEYVFVSQGQYQTLKDESKSWDHSDIYGESYGADIDQAEALMRTGKSLIVATKPELELVNDLKDKYGQNSKLILIDVPTITSNERVATQRSVDEQSRLIYDSNLDTSVIRSIADRVFVPTMNLEEDAIQFSQIIQSLVR